MDMMPLAAHGTTAVRVIVISRPIRLGLFGRCCQRVAYNGANRRREQRTLAAPPLGSQTSRSHFLPDLASRSECLPIRGRSKPMTTGAEVMGDGPRGRQKALRVARSLAALPVACALPRGLVGILRAVVQVPVLAVLHSRQYLLLRGTIAFQLVGDDDPRHVHQPLQQLAEEPLGGVLVPTALHQDVEHRAILIDRPPQVVPFAIDREKYLVQVPLVARPGPSMPELIRVGLAERAAPLPNRFIRHENATSE
jgi:hypothetical protein